MPEAPLRMMLLGKQEELLKTRTSEDKCFFRQRPRHPAVLKHIFYPKPLDNGSRARILASPKEGMPTLVQSFNHSMAKGEGTHEESGKAVDNRVFQYRPTTQGEKEGPYIRL